MSTKLKIVFMINNLYGGGAEKILQTLLGQLDQDVYDITLYGVKNEKYDTALYPKGVQYRSVYNGGYKGGGSLKNQLSIKIMNKLKSFVYNRFSAKVFYKWFIKGDYDVEVAFIEGYSTRIISGSNQNSIKIAWVHIDLEANHWSEIAYNNYEDECNSYTKFDHIVSVSKSVQDAFSRKFNMNKRLTVKYNPVDRENIIEKSKLKPTVNIESDKVLQLVTVGRLEPQKGYDRLLEVLNRLKNESFSFHLRIIGEGSQRSELENYIKNHKLQNEVNLMGFQSNPYQFIALADAFVCSSRSEGFSTVVTEALILGKPVVATDCAGMLELLGKNEFGLITENNKEALYEGLKRFLEDEKLRAYYTEKSKERSGDFDSRKTLARIEELWKK